MVEYAFHPSAEKRGHSHREVIGAWESWIGQAWLESDIPGRPLRIGFDASGRAVEVVGICFEGGERVLFIHVMALRKSTVQLVRSSQEER